MLLTEELKLQVSVCASVHVCVIRVILNTSLNSCKNTKEEARALESEQIPQVIFTWTFFA